jgi:hypothetical protein
VVEIGLSGWLRFSCLVCISQWTVRAGGEWVKLKTIHKRKASHVEAIPWGCFWGRSVKIRSEFLSNQLSVWGRWFIKTLSNREKWKKFLSRVLKPGGCYQASEEVNMQWHLLKLTSYFKIFVAFEQTPSGWIWHRKVQNKFDVLTNSD